MLTGILETKRTERENPIRMVEDYLASLGLKRATAVVFGSMAQGSSHPASDIDLLVVSDELPGVNP